MSAARESAGTTDQNVVVASFNIRAGSAAGSAVRPLLRPTASTLERLGAHIIGLQEVDRRSPRSVFRDQSRWLAAKVGASSEFAAARRLPVGGLYGVALLSSFPVSAVENHVLPNERGLEPRVGLLASVTTPAGRLTVAVCHLHNVAAPIPDDGGLAGRQLDDLLDASLDRPGPHLVMGDLNLQADHVEPIAARHGFSAIRSEPTFPSTRPRRQLDWFLVRGLDLCDVTVVDERSSDHRPIVARVEWPGPSAPRM